MYVLWALNHPGWWANEEAKEDGSILSLPLEARGVHTQLLHIPEASIHMEATSRSIFLVSSSFLLPSLPLLLLLLPLFFSSQMWAESH